MRILHINSYYSASNFYKNLYDKQIDSGLNIEVYVPVSKDRKAFSLDLGKYTTISANHSKYDRVFFHIKHRKIYKDIVKKFNVKSFDIIHAHSLFSNGYIALRLKKKYGVPYIVAVRNTDVNIFFKYMFHLRGLGVEILKQADKVIFLSTSYGDLVIKKYVPTDLKKQIYDKTEIIPNGIDDFWFENKGTVKAKPKGKSLKMVYAGVVDKNKNITTTVKAIEQLQKNGYNVKFTIVGRIVDKKVYNQIKHFSFVQYIQPKPKEKLIEIYRANDIFIMPSIHETFGLVYAEAMSQGLPVIYTKGQGFDGQFSEGLVGYHVDCFNAEQISERVIDIISNYKIVSGNCIKVCYKFDWTKIVSKYSNIYGFI